MRPNLRVADKAHYVTRCNYPLVSPGLASTQCNHDRGSLASPTCAVEGCGRAPESRGYCHGHYERFRSGRPVGGPFSETRLDFFKSRIRVEGDCWIWTGATDGDGRYGSIWEPSEQRSIRAHRWALRHLAGVEVPDGRVVDHLCRQTLCVNPDHLDIVDQRENILRGNWGGAVNARKTHCKHGHLLTSDNLTEHSKARGWRQCLTCCEERNERRRGLQPIDWQDRFEAGEKLRARREELSLSQKAAGEMVGIGQGHVGQIERRGLGGEAAIALALALDLDPEPWRRRPNTPSAAAPSEAAA